MYTDWHSNTLFSIHPYYTPIFTEFQAILAKTSFFVDYDGELCKLSYVNYRHSGYRNFYHFQLFFNILGNFYAFLHKILILQDFLHRYRAGCLFHRPPHIFLFIHLIMGFCTPSLPSFFEMPARMPVHCLPISAVL